MKTIIKKATLTAAATNSDPPWEMGWAKSLNLEGYAEDWGNADNVLTCDVYWGIPKDGYFKAHLNMYWQKDTSLSVTVTPGATLATTVAFFLHIPEVKARHVKVVFNLAGTTQSVDVVAWLSGISA